MIKKMKSVTARCLIAINSRREIKNIKRAPEVIMPISDPILNLSHSLFSSERKSCSDLIG